MFAQILFIVCISIALVYLIIQLSGLISLFFTRQRTVLPEELPFISILVAARNEEQNLASCIESLLALDFPAENIEILIGNDRSEDNTGAIAERFAKQHSRLQVFHLDGTEFTQTKGKARVLAFLASKAKGTYLFITDADIEVNPEWVSELLSFFEKDTALVSGITKVQPFGLTGSLQSLDWMYFMSLINGFSQMGLNLTAVGNNMAVTQEAYRATGGYEKMSFSITEDYKLFKEVRKLGYQTKNLLTPGSVVYSKPIDGFVNWLHQRKRWLKGAMELPFLWQLTLSFIALFYFVFPILVVLNFKVAIVIWLIKFALLLLHLKHLENLIGQKTGNLFQILFYEIYQLFAMPLMALFFLYPGKIKWKGRTF
jgi:cellulose synthase/poly-beta-1,6-N-acetylglucosamine synthase-like glycosyltransferase